MKTLQRIIFLFAVLACAIQPTNAYEYFTIYFTDGTKSEPFFATDVDSIRYSKLDLDSIEYADWQVQEIWTVDSVYRYPLLSIDNLSFTDVDENKVADDIDNVNHYIAPLYMQCNDAAELSSYLPTIKDIEGVKNAWVDHQTLFVDIQDYGTISYIYPPAMKHGGIQFSCQTAQYSRGSTATSVNEHQHVNLGKACIYNQTIKDENPFFDAANDVYEEFCGMCESMGISYDHYDNLSPSFFNNGIFDYDYVFLMTHGEYDSKKNLHWLYTNEELLCVNDENWTNYAQAWLNFFKKYRTFSSNKLGIGVHKEIRDGKPCVIYYTKVSENFITSSTRHFANKGNAIVFNAACQSLKGNQNMAKAFTGKGAGCYLGYTETNDIGHIGGQDFFVGLLNAQCVSSAKKSIPENNQKETWVNNKTGEKISVQLSMYPEGSTANSICFIEPETLDAEIESNDGNSSLTLKGQIKMLLPGLYNKYEVGFVVADNKEMNDTTHYTILGSQNETSRYLTFEKTLDVTQLQPATTYYYRAFMNDGYSECYGEVRSFSTVGPYAVLNGETLTFYYDSKKTEREGTVYEVEENYPSWESKPAWSDKFTTAAFDASFANYRPTSTAYWFYECSSLKSIENIAHLNTSNVTSMYSMFYDCSSLNSLDVSSFDTSNVTVMSYMFRLCSSLTSLDLSSFDTSNVTDMREMFSGCRSLTSLDVSYFDTSNVTNMYEMFDGCSSLTSLDLSSFDTSNVTNLGGMFGSCRSLESLDLSSFNTSNVTDMWQMFAGCSSLTSLDFRNLNISRCSISYCNFPDNIAVLDLRNIIMLPYMKLGYLFNNPSSLKKLNLSNANTSNMISMAYMFQDFSSLTSLDLSHFDTSNVTNMAGMFMNCSSLTSLNVSSFDTSNVTDMGGMFGSCRSLESLDLSSFDTSNVTDMSVMFGSCRSLESLDLSSFNTSNVTDMGGMFEYCSSLTSLDLSHFDTSNVTDMGGMFSSCDSLTYIDFRNLNFAKCGDKCPGFPSNIAVLDVRNIIVSNYCRGLFRNKKRLRTLNLSNANSSNATNMYEMFKGCSSLTSLDLSSFNTSNVTDMGDMFDGCSSLTSLDLSHFNTSNVTDMGKMFYGCSSLASLDVSSFDTSNVTNMSWMFHCCSSLASLNVSNFNTSNVTSVLGMFYGCSNLQTIYGGNWSRKYYDGEMFTGCDALRGGKGTKIGSNLYGYDTKGKPLYYECPSDGGAAHIDDGENDPGLFTAK